MALKRVVAVADLPPGRMMGVNIGEKTLLLANVAGKFHSINDRCTHAHCALSRGTLEGAVVTCPCHSSKFDVRDGRVISGPAKAAELPYPVKAQGKDVFIDA